MEKEGTLKFLRSINMFFQSFDLKGSSCFDCVCVLIFMAGVKSGFGQQEANLWLRF